MGLRLLAHYYEPVEALIARSVIEAAGMLAILHNHQWLSVMPYHVGALGGYRLVVSEDDFEDAVAVLREAKANPLLDGEVYESEADFKDRVFSFLFGFIAGGSPMPIRDGRWIASLDDHEHQRPRDGQTGQPDANVN